MQKTVQKPHFKTSVKVILVASINDKHLDAWTWPAEEDTESCKNLEKVILKMEMSTFYHLSDRKRVINKATDSKRNVHRV